MVPYARCSGMEMGKEVSYVSLLAKGTYYRHSLTVNHEISQNQAFLEGSYRLYSYPIISYAMRGPEKGK